MASTDIRALALASGLFAVLPAVAGPAVGEGSAVFGVELPAGYRDWRLIGVAHEAGGLNDLRAVLGNDIAVQAFRDGTRPFPDGTMIARVAWQHVPSPENNAAFGQPQSFVAGAATNVQISVKDGRKYASTGGWGFGQFEAGRPNQDAALLNTCFPCHSGAPGTSDHVFTRYAP